MKKIFYLASIAALAFSSCAKDETTEVTLGTVAGGEIVASVGDSDTRAYLDANQKFRWQDGDKLAVYGKGTYPMFNSTYAWKSGFTQGVFEGEKAFNADGNYLAVYPRHTTSLITETQWADAWISWGYIPGSNYSQGTFLKLSGSKATDTRKATGVTLQIPAEQKFQPGSFYQDIVPAMSTTFDVQENGNAEVDMQPVADYLFVNIKATDPIEKLSLKLNDGKGNFLPIAGQGNPTAYYLNGNVRYYLSNDGMNTDVIDLVTNDYAADVTCHEPQTYVFVIPGGILGSKNLNNDGENGVEAWIWVNEKAGSSYANADVDFIATSRDLSTSSVKNAKFDSNVQMNYYYDHKWTQSTQDDVLIVRGDETVDVKKAPMGDLATKNMQMENMYFWMNSLDNKGNRKSFVYNPEGVAIIETEGQLLEYLAKYDTDNTYKYYQKGAYICDNHHFDFSEANIKKLSSELKANKTYPELQEAYDNYLNGQFPTIENYDDVFNGNNAVISGIEEPLKGMGGIFGNIKSNAVIMDVTFDGIVADEADADDDDMYPGVVLGSMEGGKLSKVTVKNAEGMAILNKANSAALGQLTVEGVEGLNFIALDMDLNAGTGSNDYTKTWDVMSDVKEAVFGTLDATGHQIVVLPEGADYADLAWYVSTANSSLAGNIYKIVAGVANYKAEVAKNDDNNAVSVLVGATSVWTGDKIPVTATWYGKRKVTSTHAWADYAYVQYAEQLAGLGASQSAALVNNMDMSYAVNSWEAPASTKVLAGNSKTISGIKMKVAGATTFAGSSAAPFLVKEISGLTVEGITININTDKGSYVPQFIGGLAKDAKIISNVVVNDLTITGSGDGNNNEYYDPNWPSYIGWLVANTNDITITSSSVSGVKNDIRGTAGMVGIITLTKGNSAKIANSSASVVATPQKELANFWDYNSSSYQAEIKTANYAGTAVGRVDNTTGEPRTIEFEGTTGKPVFIYYSATDKDDINVLYDDSKVILKNGDKQYK